MKRLNQRDPLWGKLRLGASTLTMEKFGCTTTSTSMLSDYFGCFVSPDKICRTKKNYTIDGLILWQNLNFSCFKFVSREYRRNDAKINEFLKDPKKAVLLQVDNGAHWVVGVKKDLFGRWICADPWLGRDVDVINTYKNITGAAYFTKK